MSFVRFLIGFGVGVLLGPVLAAFLAYIAFLFLRRTGRDQKVKLLLFSLFEKLVFPLHTERQDRPVLLGRFDGSADGEVYGWALNPKEESTAPKITICVGNRPVGEVVPVHYRPDIGRHCFYFDLSRICAPSSDARVDAKFADGHLLPNSPLTVSIPARRESSHSETILFMHIAKTAGTAFREAMEENYKQSEIAYLYPDPPGFLYENLGFLSLEQRRAFRLVIGHFQYGIHDFLPQQSTYVTIVREPVSRIISHYRYGLEMHLGGASGKDSAASLVEALEKHASVNLDNLMVRCFAGIDEKDVPPGCVDAKVYSLALDHLRNAFSFVGHQERANEAYMALHRRFQWKSRSALAAVNRSALTREADYESARQAIEHFNRWDCRLYAEIQRLFP